MDSIQDLLKSKIKSKEKTTFLANMLKKDKKVLNDLITNFETASAPNKGTCIEALELITKDDPAYVLSSIDFIIEQISNKIPRVKMESSRVVANISVKYPEEAGKAIPNLLMNTKDEGTVIRWSAAFALSEIAKNDPGSRAELIPKFKYFIEKEQNNGVKNNYVKALKQIEKENKKKS